jgi:hypothetical protein
LVQLLGGRSNVVLNSEKTLQNWLNAYVFHKDKNKTKIINDLHDEFFPLEMSKALWLSLLQDQANAVIGLTSLISKIRK